MKKGTPTRFNKSIPGNDKQKRKCLKCDKNFISQNIGNRICYKCKRILETYGYDSSVNFEGYPFPGNSNTCFRKKTYG